MTQSCFIVGFHAGSKPIVSKMVQISRYSSSGLSQAPGNQRNPLSLLDEGASAAWREGNLEPSYY